jgi:DNA (cytosine-5)-methyltransferase 1
MPTKNANKLKAVDFFCGAGGMSYGLQSAGVHVLGGIDNSADCRDTYLANINNAKFIKHDISTLSAPELGRRLGIRENDDNLIFAGCSPCQFWSKIRTDKTKSKKTAHLLRQFQKFIKHFRPGYVIVENVPGLYRRTDESILPKFLDFLKKNGYAWDDGVINANHYGVPQNRIRYLLVATRLADKITLPEPSQSEQLNVQNFLGIDNGFKKIPAGHKDETTLIHTAAALSDLNLRRIAMTEKSGGNRAAWSDNEELQIAAYKGKDTIFRDVYGRMYWDKPAPTITTRFNSLSNGRFGHPEEDRALSLREGATLQTFPKTFIFQGPNQQSLAKQIGNAVPPELAKRIASHLSSVINNG